MAGSLMTKLRNFLGSPQGRRVVDQGRRAAADPRNRERAKGLLGKLRKR